MDSESSRERGGIAEKNGRLNRVPLLIYARGYQKFEKDYAKLLERYNGDYFYIGWKQGDMDPGGYIQVEISGFKVLVHHTTLKELDGKELLLDTVEVGYPIPASNKRHLLRARHKGEGGKEKKKEKEEGDSVS